MLGLLQTMCQRDSVVLAARPRVWYDMRQLVGADGAACATLQDRSGNAIHALQTDAAKKPIIKRGVTGGTVLRFDGTTSCMRTTATLDLSNTQAITVIAITSSTAGIICEYSNDSNVAGGRWAIYRTASVISMVGRGNVDYSARDSAAAYTGMRSIGGTWDCTLSNPEIAIFADGAPVSSNAVLSGNNTGSMAASQPVNIGARNNGLNSFMAGDIAQLVIFDRKLTDTHFAAVSRALLSMCGI